MTPGLPSEKRAGRFPGARASACTHTHLDGGCRSGPQAARLVTVPTPERPSAQEAVTQQEAGQLAMLCHGRWRPGTGLSHCLLLQGRRVLQEVDGSAGNTETRRTAAYHQVPRTARTCTCEAFPGPAAAGSQAPESPQTGVMLCCTTSRWPRHGSFDVTPAPHGQLPRQGGYDVTGREEQNLGPPASVRAVIDRKVVGGGWVSSPRVLSPFR